LIANLAIAFEGFADDAAQFRREIGIELERWRGFFVKDGVEGGGGSVSAKGERAGGHFVEDGAERKNVGADW